MSGPRNMDADQQAIRQVLAGNADSFRALVEKYERPLFVLVRNLVRDAGDAEDIAQETFVAAYANLKSYDPGRAKFSTWLFAMARNRCLNWLKRRRPLVTARLPEGIVQDTPGSRLDAEATFQRLDAALDELPVEQRTAFVLAEIQGLSYRDIVRIEGVRLGTVKSRIARAKQKLRNCLRDVVEQS